MKPERKPKRCGSCGRGGVTVRSGEADYCDACFGQEFLDELDRRIDGTSQVEHPPDSRAQLAAIRGQMQKMHDEMGAPAFGAYVVATGVKLGLTE